MSTRKRLRYLALATVFAAAISRLAVAAASAAEIALPLGIGADQDGKNAFPGDAAPPADSLTLWWRRPGNSWTEAMVLGNGRLGAMVSGGVRTEKIWLNEDTLWSGEPSVPNNPEAIRALPEVRRLLIERKE